MAILSKTFGRISRSQRRIVDQKKIVAIVNSIPMQREVARALTDMMANRTTVIAVIKAKRMEIDIKLAEVDQLKYDVRELDKMLTGASDYIPDEPARSKPELETDAMVKAVVMATRDNPYRTETMRIKPRPTNANGGE